MAKPTGKRLLAAAPAPAPAAAAAEEPLADLLASLERFGSVLSEVEQRGNITSQQGLCPSGARLCMA